MKKILIILCLLAFSVQADDLTSMCSTANAKKSLSGNLLSLSGINFLSRNFVENEIKKAFKKETNSTPKVKVESFYGTNFFNGEFKNLSGTSKNITYKGFYFSDLEFNSVCDYNKITYKNNALSFDTNFLLKYKTTITQNDLNKYIATTNYAKTIEKLNNDKNISSLFKIDGGKIQIKQDKLVFKYKVIPFPKTDLGMFSNFIKPVDVAFSGGIRVEDDKIKLCDIDFNSFKFAYDAFLPFINMTNPTKFDIKVDKNNNGTLKVQNAIIENEKIVLDGYVFVNQNPIN